MVHSRGKLAVFGGIQACFYIGRHDLRTDTSRTARHIYSTCPEPVAHPRRILLAVSGLSTQIVTETIYALAAQSPSPFIPAVVHLITTREGAQHAELSLLSDDLGWFRRLCADYRLPPFATTRQHIHFVRDALERDMVDIRSVADNQAAAEFITSRVREFTGDPDCALHVS